MVQPKPADPARPADTTPKQRLSVSLDASDHADLKRLATEQRVSLAWVVREAVGEYIYRRSPLFRRAPVSHGDPTDTSTPISGPMPVRRVPD